MRHGVDSVADRTVKTRQAQPCTSGGLPGIRRSVPATFALPYDLLVAFWDPVLSRHVQQAVAEYDQLGQDEFLARHGFGPARAYLLILDDKSYDSKAILGVAYGYATGRPLGPGDFSGGVHGAADVLSVLGFEIINTRDRDPSDSLMQ